MTLKEPIDSAESKPQAPARGPMPTGGAASDLSMVQAGAMRASWLVVLTGVLAAMHVGKLSPALPQISHDLDISWVQSGFLMSLVQLAGMCFGLVLGISCEWLGLRRCLWVGQGVLALASAAGTLFSEVNTLLMLRGIEGIGYFLVALSGPGLLRQLLPPRRLHAMLGVWGAFMPLGVALALLMVPWLMQWEGWRAVWCVLSCLSVLMAGLILLLMPPVHIQGKPNAVRRDWRGQIKTSVSTPGAWVLGLTFASFSGPWVAGIGFLPSIYVMGQLSMGHAGTLTALVVAVNILGNLAAGQMLQKGVAADRVIRWAFLGMGIGAWFAFGIHADQHWNLSYAGAVLFSACGGLIPATVFSQIVKISPDPSAISTTQGLIQQCNALGQFAGPPVMGWVASHWGGWQATGVGMVLICMEGIVLSFTLRHLMNQTTPANLIKPMATA